MKEADLDRLFANMLDESSDFASWVLSNTKFNDRASSVYLLKKQQIAARPSVEPIHWYRHWWCRLPNGTESETDIFAVFQRGESDHRFALHIENKPPWGVFTPGQQESYAVRAEYMARKDRYLNYSEFETLLIAPQSVWDKDLLARGSFSAFTPYEEIAEWIPEFGIN